MNRHDVIIIGTGQAGFTRNLTALKAVMRFPPGRGVRTPNGMISEEKVCELASSSCKPDFLYLSKL
jgi:hypothetical protein